VFDQAGKIARLKVEREWHAGFSALHQFGDVGPIGAFKVRAGIYKFDLPVHKPR
jgi:hypothetical protein